MKPIEEVTKSNQTQSNLHIQLHHPSNSPRTSSKLIKSSSNPSSTYQSSSNSHHHHHHHHHHHPITHHISRFLSLIYFNLIQSFIHLIQSLIQLIWVPKPNLIRSSSSSSSNAIHHHHHPFSIINSHSNRLGLSKQSYLICLILFILGLIELIFNSPSADSHHPSNPIRLHPQHAPPFDFLKQNSLLPDLNHHFNHSLNQLEHRWIRPRSNSNSTGRSTIQADVTAILLNWNRPQNLIFIIAHLCRYDFIHSIIIWNNHHQSTPLKREDFIQSECPNHQISIINSPSNLYFLSRYLACLQSSTEFCYFQDDDTIVTSIRSMYQQFKLNPQSIVVQSDPLYSVMYGHEWCFKDQSGKLHTCFAWLGHGSFVSKGMVLDFLNTVSSLSLPADQIALADNFFTTSFNQKPLVMLTSQIFNIPSLAIGFSDGHSGLQRNRLYIQKGVEELSKMLEKKPLIEEAEINPEALMIKSTNLLDSYTFITNTENFPSSLPIYWSSDHFSTLNEWENRLGKIGKSLSILENEKAIEDGIWSEGEDWVIRFPYSSAIDNDLSTCWRSINSISKNEFIGIRLIDKIKIQEKISFHLTINRSNELFDSILIEGLMNETKWIALSISEFKCQPIQPIELLPLIGIKEGLDKGEGSKEDWIESCSTQVIMNDQDQEVKGLELGGIRLISLVDHLFGWNVWEIEVRVEE
ncbi:hypothetical protein DFH28DRAFT_1220280 [Melampsora americana]|nr:hypothetical protein DFH28DRAFT_1220280 [Melampsora americana]